MPTLVEIVDYDQRWPARFQASAHKLSSLLGSLASSIEHVGSTAVPGLAAKPLVDIDITLTSADVIGEVLDPEICIRNFQRNQDRNPPQGSAT